jgi:hypothetical protein
VIPNRSSSPTGWPRTSSPALSRYPSLFVIARNSCFTYKDRAVDVKQVGWELGVRYVLEGGVRKSGDRIRVAGPAVVGDRAAHAFGALIEKVRFANDSPVERATLGPLR